MNTSTITKTALGFAVVAALLTGCSATGSTTDLVPTSKPEATSAPATDVAAPADAERKTGDVVDAGVAAAIKEAGNGQRAYPMSDGTFVVVTKTEPLPAQVQADVDAKTASTLSAVTSYSADMNAAEATLGKAQAAIAVGTGKRVLIVWRVLGFRGLSEVETYGWFIAGGPALGQIFDEKTQAQAAVDGWLASKDNASEYAVVYVG